MPSLRNTRSLCAIAFAAACGPLQAAESQSGTAFNPKISLILNGTYAHYDANAPARIGGFLLGDETELTPSGLSLGETELAIESNIDTDFHGWAAISVEPDGSVGVEEAYINTLALPHGLALKFGRFKSDIGYQNHIHAHAWEFADAPLAYRAMLGTQLQDDGVQLRWLAPTDLFWEVGAEGFRGAAFPAGGDDRSGVKTKTVFTHIGGDFNDSSSWRVGLSFLDASADHRDTEEQNLTTDFDGNSRTGIVDLVYKWAPHGNVDVTNFLFNAEFLHRHEYGDVVGDVGGTHDASSYRGTQDGGYAQGVYQFLPRWRAGLRYDWLQARNTLDTPAASLANLADDGHAAQRYSVMGDYSNSEFSRFRLQYNRDLSRPNHEPDNQVLVQYIFSLGSHPAHQF